MGLGGFRVSRLTPVALRVPSVGRIRKPSGFHSDVPSCFLSVPSRSNASRTNRYAPLVGSMWSGKGHSGHSTGGSNGGFWGYVAFLLWIIETYFCIFLLSLTDAQLYFHLLIHPFQDCRSNRPTVPLSDRPTVSLITHHPSPITIS